VFKKKQGREQRHLVIEKVRLQSRQQETKTQRTCECLLSLLFDFGSRGHVAIADPVRVTARIRLAISVLVVRCDGLPNLSSAVSVAVRLLIQDRLQKKKQLYQLCLTNALTNTGKFLWC